MDITGLPIDVVPGTNPPRFRWRTTVSTMDSAGHRVQDCEGALPSSVEVAVAKLVEVAKEALKDNAMLRGQVTVMTERIAAQSDILSRRAERESTAPVPTLPPHQQQTPKKVRG